MRLREPLSGFRFATEHWLFHLTFLIGSFIVINHSDESGWSHLQTVWANEDHLLQMQKLVVLSRIIHFYVLVSQIIGSILTKFNCILLIRLLKNIDIFVCQGNVLYQ